MFIKNGDAILFMKRLVLISTINIFILTLCLVGVITYCRKDPVVSASAQISATRQLPIYCVDTDQPQISLTFDAAWDDSDINDILAILKKYDVKATFFMTGEWVSNYPDAVKAIAADGHDLANHGDTHAHMSEMSLYECEAEIMGTHEKVKALTGIEMNLFRPPYGEYNDTVIQSAAACSYYAIQWDVDSLDWKNYGVSDIVTCVSEHNHLGNGSIILLHNGATYTKDALESLIIALTEQGYTLVPVSQLIYDAPYTLDYEGRQHKQ
jgi:polysaccharide deacetylase family sporulation protein PdaB